MIRSAERMVESRWATTRDVRPDRIFARALWSSCSVTGSTLEVASSRMRIFGSRASARANDPSFRCPTASRPPRPRDEPAPPGGGDPPAAGPPRGPADRSPPRLHVLPDGPGEEERVLEDEGDHPAKLAAGDLPPLPSAATDLDPVA